MGEFLSPLPLEQVSVDNEEQLQGWTASQALKTEEKAIMILGL